MVTTSSKLSLPQGALITGRWRGGRYLVQRVLGQGANGVVYLVKQDGTNRLYALKMGFDSLDIHSEINALKALQRQGRWRLPTQRDAGGYLVEVDDYTLHGRKISFYVMRYIKGEPLKAFIKRRGARWLDVAGLNLLAQLKRLHDLDWVFGDLKPENVLVGHYGEVELIDYGGVSSLGRSVKQFTEWYDRGFWNAGNRLAEPSYDWFSFAALCIHLLCEERFKHAATQLPQTRCADDLLTITRSDPALVRYRDWLERALQGRFQSSAEAYLLWKKSVFQSEPHEVRRHKSDVSRWMIGAFIVSITLLVYSIYLVFRIG